MTPEEFKSLKKGTIVYEIRTFDLVITDSEFEEGYEPKSNDILFGRNLKNKGWRAIDQKEWGLLRENVPLEVWRNYLLLEINIIKSFLGDEFEQFRKDCLKKV